MIEITWNYYLCENYDMMMMISNLLAWLCTSIAQDEELHKVKMSGYLVVRDPSGVLSTLIVCTDPSSQMEIHQLLQQPPEEYKGKYVSKITFNDEEAEQKAEEKEEKESKT